MYRPENWENPYEGISTLRDAGNDEIAVEKPCMEYKAYEAGADAMLVAIRVRGHINGESLRNVEGAIGWAGIDPNSKWYPIPDDK